MLIKRSWMKSKKKKLKDCIELCKDQISKIKKSIGNEIENNIFFYKLFQIKQI